MSSLNTVTGRNGKFVVASTLVARAKKWTVNPALASSAEWGDSDSAGFTNRASGRKDATWDSEGVYDSTNEVFDIFQPGDIPIVTLWMDATSLYWDFPRSLVTEFSLEVDIDTEEVIGWTTAGGADGVFHYPGEVGQASRTVP